jgi:hypothetical protein
MWLYHPPSTVTAAGLIMDLVSVITMQSAGYCRVDDGLLPLPPDLL